MSKIRKCIVCGKTYEFCPHCNKDNNIRWMAEYCSQDCKQAFDICSRFVGGAISGEEAYEKFSKLQLNNIKDSIKDSVDKIMTYKPKAVEQPKLEPQEPTEEKPKYKRPRRRKMQKSEE